MQGIYRFLRSTIFGGLVILVPLIAACAIVLWVIKIAYNAISPIFAWLPDASVGGVSLTLLSVVVGMVVCCFLAGLLAETAVVRGLGQRAEWLAQTIPGYALMKNIGANLVGIDAKRPVRTVVVQFEATSQLGFLMDTLDDGHHVVFVPGVPRALVGTLHIVAADRMQVLDIPIATTLDVLGRLVVGLREKWPRASDAV